MVQLLLKAGADPNLPNSVFGQTPLHYAVDCGYVQLVRPLMQYRADPRLTDKHGKSAFDLAQTDDMREALERFQGDFLTPEEMPSFSQSEIREVPISLDSPLPPQAVSRPLHDWLEQRNLEELESVLEAAGYDDVEAMIEQMRSPLPLNEENMRAIGVIKPGLCVRLIYRLEEEAGLVQKRTRRRAPSLMEGEGIEQGTATFGNAGKRGVRDWLHRIKLEQLTEKFEEAGYDDVDALISMMTWRRPITDSILELELRISKPGYRSRILSKLQEESQGFSRSYMPVHARSESSPGLSIESSSKTAACNPCVIS